MVDDLPKVDANLAAFESAATTPTSTPEGGPLPITLIVGAKNTGKRRLLSALAGANTEAIASPVLHSIINTKYYSAKLTYKVVDLEDGPLDSKLLADLTCADAVLLVWDASHWDTFLRIQLLGDALLQSNAGEEEQERVRLCIALELAVNGGAENITASARGKNEEIIRWCVERGFEYLCCPLTPVDIKAVQVRRQQANSSLRTKLDDDTDGTVVRVMEALECHQWPGLSRHAATARKVVDSAAEMLLATTTQASADKAIARVIVVGVEGVPHHALVSTLAEHCLDQKYEACPVIAEAELETRYYHARLRFYAVDVCAASKSTSPMFEGFTSEELFDSADGVLLVWDPCREQTWQAVREFFELQYAIQSAAYEEKRERRRDGVARLCIAAGQRSDEWSGEEDVVEGWCAEHGFEYIRTLLGQQELDTIGRRWRSGQAGMKPLVARERMESQGAAERIVDALATHTWPGLTAKQALGNLSNGSTDSNVRKTCQPQETSALVEDGRVRQKPANVGSHEISVDLVERLAEDMAKVRNMTDADQRRERACELATLLAEALGEDEDDDDD